MKHLEKGVGLVSAPRAFVRDLNADNLSAGLVAGIFGLSAGVIHISAGTAAGLDPTFIMVWVISYFVINGTSACWCPPTIGCPYRWPTRSRGRCSSRR